MFFIFICRAFLCIKFKNGQDHESSPIYSSNFGKISKQWKGNMSSPPNTKSNHLLLFRNLKWTELTVINRKIASLIEKT